MNEWMNEPTKQRKKVIADEWQKYIKTVPDVNFRLGRKPKKHGMSRAPYYLHNAK